MALRADVVPAVRPLSLVDRERVGLAAARLAVSRIRTAEVDERALLRHEDHIHHECHRTLNGIERLVTVLTRGGRFAQVPVLVARDVAEALGALRAEAD